MRIILIFLTVVSFAKSQTLPPPNIDKKCLNEQEVAVLFLNGIQNTTNIAQKSKEKIVDLVENDPSKTRISPNGLGDICYKYIYKG